MTSATGPGPDREERREQDGHGDHDWDGFDEWAGEASGRSAAGPDLDPRIQAGVDHLQRAAHEVIEASRALLDVAEDLIDSPGGIPKLLGALGELGELAGRVARSQVAGARPGSGPDDDPDPDPPVQRIPVS